MDRRGGTYEVCLTAGNRMCFGSDEYRNRFRKKSKSCMIISGGTHEKKQMDRFIDERSALFRGGLAVIGM